MRTTCEDMSSLCFSEDMSLLSLCDTALKSFHMRAFFPSPLSPTLLSFSMRFHPFGPLCPLHLLLLSTSPSPLPQLLPCRSRCLLLTAATASSQSSKSIHFPYPLVFSPTGSIFFLPVVLYPFFWIEKRYVCCCKSSVGLYQQ